MCDCEKKPYCVRATQFVGVNRSSEWAITPQFNDGATTGNAGGGKLAFRQRSPERKRSHVFTIYGQIKSVLSRLLKLQA